MERKELTHWISVYLKGLAMGAADAVPGVSGGTIALITGIYERLISAITSFNFQDLRKFTGSFHPSNSSNPLQVFLELDGHFLIVLFAGILTSLLTVLRLVDYLLAARPVMTYAFFFGLIAVSAVVLYRKVDLSTRGRKISAVTGFMFAFLASGYATTALGHSPLIVFLSGIAAVSAMVLPGISGSLILIILGQYGYMAGAVSGFLDTLLKLMQGNSFSVLSATDLSVMYFVAGAFIGILTVSHLVRKALEHRREATMAFLISLVVGALRAPLIQVEQVMAEEGIALSMVIPSFLVASLAGGLAVYLIDYYSGGMKIMEA